MSSKGKDDAEKLKKSFAGYMGVVVSSDNADFQWAAYLYGASANIEKLINQELKELSLESSAKTAKKSETPPPKKEGDIALGVETKPVPLEEKPSEKKAPPEKKMEFPKRAPKPEEKTPDASDAKAEKSDEPAKKEEKTEKPSLSEGAVAETAQMPVIEAPAKGAESAGPVIEQFEKSSAPPKAVPGVADLLETFDKPAASKAPAPETAVSETKPEPAKTEKIEGATAPKTADLKAAPEIEKFEQFTPDQSVAKPLAGPLIETFAEKTAEPKTAAASEASKEEAAAPPVKETEPEKTEAPPVRKDAKAIDVLYLCPEKAKDKADIVKENIAKIVAEKNINFDFKPAGVVVYSPGASKESVMEEIAKYKFSFVLVVAPDALGEELLREIKKKGFVPKVITDDNIDKKFRYLNLITDIVLSPRR